MYSVHEVGTVEGNEQKNIIDEGHAHEGPYQVEKAQFVSGNKSYNFKPNINLATHYTPALRNHVTPRFPVRPDWRIRTEFGVRDHILGLFT